MLCGNLLEQAAKRNTLKTVILRGERTLAVHANGASWNEYVYLNGQPMADMDYLGNWTDYIYANGQKIAAAAAHRPVLQLSGTCGNCIGGNANFTVSGLSSSLTGYTIQAGDAIVFRQKQSGAAQAGLYLYGHVRLTGRGLSPFGQHRCPTDGS